MRQPSPAPGHLPPTLNPHPNFIAHRAGDDRRLRLRAGLRWGNRAILFLLLTLSSVRADLNPTVLGWLNAQTNIHTWSAELTQTRTLKTLTQPLTAQGRVWFAAPNRFRWEIGSPVSTIALRQAGQMLVIYPRLKRVEKYPLTGEQAGSWKDTLALLEAGFPRSQAELESRFRILSQTSSNESCQLALQPRSASARRLMPEIRISFHTRDFALLGTELQFADGSTMRNDFRNATLNPKLEEAAVFNPPLDAGYKMIEPLRR